ncbi:MAG: UvrD-helicase domain-containing protein [Prevotellaceae bacterium]|nr:UvrD-helicase domain-containing protein [Prevotellaceae bacterium]
MAQSNNAKEQKPLTVYRASAGSGKTFTLATQFISLLINNPSGYGNILAVTFTNKATGEMKQRILSQLYGIAHRLPGSDDYLSVVRKNTGLSDDEIARRAGVVLKNLLHHYSYFRVETIDAFFQTVLRNLARELDLTANLKVSLNDYEVLDEAVDELIESLDDKSPVLFWIMDYIHEKMSDDKGWNVIGQIKSFGANIFKDDYKAHQEELEKLFYNPNNADFFNGLKKELSEQCKNTLDEVKCAGESFFDKLEAYGFSPNDLKGKNRGISSYFNKLRNGNFTDDDVLNTTTQKCLDDPANWVNKKDAKDDNRLFALVKNDLYPILEYCEKQRKTWVKDYLSAKLTLNHLSQLRLLGTIAQRVRENNAAANRFLLSDTQTLLKGLIKNEDSPFIFEKIGSMLNHIMIDEFQDTSSIQWDNFKKLLLETMSHSDPNNGAVNNLLVGDVKQSIYRWRNGDWRLLNNINQQFSPDSLDLESLQTNWRSLPNIITFNNAFFRRAAYLTGQEIGETSKRRHAELLQAYADVDQNIPAKKKEKGGGYVEIDFLANDKDSYEDETLQKTAETVQQLLYNKVEAKDIAILVRSNATIQQIGDFFMNNYPDIPLISDEAFRLDASAAVNILIAALQTLLTPDDLLCRATLVKLYQTQVLTTEAPETAILQPVYFKPSDDDKTEVMIHSLNTLLPEAYTAHFPELLKMPLVELVEHLYQIFDIEKLGGQDAYVCAFFDQLNSFAQDQVPDLAAFLSAWEDTISKKTIQSDEVNGIRLLTIHKSKGLEFDHVIMPFCDWQLEKAHTLWCSTDEKPYSKLPVIPIDFSKKQMVGSVYEEDYQEEHFQDTIDNLNLLYVAFTRAGKSLYVFTKHGDSASRRSALIEQVISSLETAMDNPVRDSKDDTPEDQLIASFDPNSDYTETITTDAAFSDLDADKKADAAFSYGTAVGAPLVGALTPQPTVGAPLVGALTPLGRPQGPHPTEDLGRPQGPHPTEELGRPQGPHPTEELGRPQGPHPTVEPSEPNVFLRPVSPLRVDIRNYSAPLIFKQSNRSEEFVSGQEDDSAPSSFIQTGDLMHKIFSSIKTTADVDRVLKELELEGVIYDTALKADVLKNMIRKRIESPKIKDWFSPKWQLFTECSILRLDPETHQPVERRPDRVMTDGHETIVVDFKLAKHHDAYHDQVKEYMDLLKAMGHQNITGYIWYVLPNRIEEVK